MSFVRFLLAFRKVRGKLLTCHIGQQDGEEDHHGEKGGHCNVQRIPAARGHLQAGKQCHIFVNMENHTWTLNDHFKPFPKAKSTSEKLGLLLGRNQNDTGLLSRQSGTDLWAPDPQTESACESVR